MSDAALIALGQAIKFESDGLDYYRGLAETLTDPLAKALFRSLAEEEKGHITRVREIYEELKAKPGWPPASTMVARAAGTLDVFENEAFSKGKLSPDATLREALAKAIELEQDGIDFYAVRLSQASCEAETEFFRHLIAEEERHFRLLSKAQKSL